MGEHVRVLSDPLYNITKNSFAFTPSKKLGFRFFAHFFSLQKVIFLPLHTEVSH